MWGQKDSDTGGWLKLHLKRKGDRVPRIKCHKNKAPVPYLMEAGSGLLFPFHLAPIAARKSAIH